MNRASLSNIFIYRHRYSISYFLIGLLLISLLYVAGFLIPGGLSNTEVVSGVKSGNVALGVFIGTQPDVIPHLPYRLLQYASIHLFGLSVFSIKLPSLLIAAISIVLFYNVLRLWFRANVAVISTIILVTSSLFLLQAQLGTPGIMYLFWGSLLLLTTSMMAHGKRFSAVWFCTSAAVAGLMLYSPFACYIIIPLIIAALFHPHARFIVFRQRIWILAISILLFVLTIIPLILGSIHDPSILLRIVAGSDVTDGTFSASGNLLQLGQYVDFVHSHSGRIIQPAYGLGLVSIALVGLIHLVRRKYTAKSYIMTVWLLLTVPILYLNPDAASVSLLPIMLLVAFGIDMLIRYWYRMFPFNPYARAAGLFPLGVLVVGLSISSLDRFIYGYRYNPDSAAAYSNDFRLTTKEINQLHTQTIQLIVRKNEVSFYTLYKATTKSDKKILVSSDINVARENNSAVLVVDRSQVDKERIPTHIITSDTKEASNRLYVYEK